MARSDDTVDIRCNRGRGRLGWYDVRSHELRMHAASQERFAVRRFISSPRDYGEVEVFSCGGSPMEAHAPHGVQIGKHELDILCREAAARGERSVTIS
jgi:hypothetical protein